VPRGGVVSRLFYGCAEGSEPGAGGVECRRGAVLPAEDAGLWKEESTRVPGMGSSLNTPFNACAICRRCSGVIVSSAWGFFATSPRTKSSALPFIVPSWSWEGLRAAAGSEAADPSFGADSDKRDIKSRPDRASAAKSLTPANSGTAGTPAGLDEEKAPGSGCAGAAGAVDMAAMDLREEAAE